MSSHLHARPGGTRPGFGDLHFRWIKLQFDTTGATGAAQLEVHAIVVALGRDSRSPEAPRVRKRIDAGAAQAQMLRPACAGSA